jgi:hypothetical protein
MNNTIFPINVESSETLVMAKEKSPIVWENYKQSIKDRMNWGHIISNRNNMESGTIVTQQFQERIDNAPKTSYSDLVICLEKTETISYTEVRSRGAIIFKCEALDTSPFGGIAMHQKNFSKSWTRNLHLNSKYSLECRAE